MPEFQFPEKFTPLLPGEDGLWPGYRWAFLRGGRGGAKTRGIGSLLTLRTSIAPKRILCAREIQNSIRDSVHMVLRDEIDRQGLGQSGTKEFIVTENEIRHINGALFIFRGLHGQSADAIKSIEGIDILWLEEAQNISQRSLDILIPTIRKPGSQIIASFNQDLESDPIFKLSNNPPDRSIVIDIGLDDNPWATRELIEQRDNEYKNDPDKARWIWGGQCRKNSEAQIFANRYSIESFEPSDKWDGPFFGLDFGFNPDPLAAVKIWLDFENKRIMWEYEAGGRNIDIDKIPFALQRIPGIQQHELPADNSRPETISYLASNGFPKIRPCEKWPGCVEDGLAKMKGWMNVIHPRCKEVASEFALYSLKVSRTGEILNDIEDKNNHYIDAGRYGLEKWIRNKSTRNSTFVDDPFAFSLR